MTQWVTANKWPVLASMLWKDMRLLAVRLDNAQRLAMCWVRPRSLAGHVMLTQITGLPVAAGCSLRQRQEEICVQIETVQSCE